MKTLLLAMGLLIATGCATARKDKLSESVNNYVRAIRRGDETLAVSYVHPDKQTEFYKNLQKLSRIHISDAEIRSIFPDEKMQTALVTMWLEYYPLGSSGVVATNRKLEWKYNETAQNWLLEETNPFGTK